MTVMDRCDGWLYRMEMKGIRFIGKDLLIGGKKRMQKWMGRNGLIKIWEKGWMKRKEWIKK
jgi:hypothetical protein